MKLSYSVYVTKYYGFEFGQFNEYFFGNFGLYWGVPEGRNMSTIKDEEELYQSLKNISNTSLYILHAKLILKSET